MAMGQQKDRQGDLMVSWSEMPRSPGHVFYDRLQLVLIEGGFDGFAEAVCQPYYAPGWGRLRCHPGATSVCTWWATSRVSTLSVGWSGAARIPCRYGSSCCWRCGNGCRTIPGCHGPALRLPHGSPRSAVFDWVLALIAEAGLPRRASAGVDATTMEANAALRNIVRRDTGEGLPGDAGALGPGERYRDTPRLRTWRVWTASARARSSRTRTGFPGATPRPRSPALKDGTTHMAFKPEQRGCRSATPAGSGAGAAPGRRGRYDNG